MSVAVAICTRDRPEPLARCLESVLSSPLIDEILVSSDGLDRGDPAVLAEAMDRLSRLCHKLIWMNPLKGDEEEFQARSVGMLIAKPFVDELLSGHDLASLEKLAMVLPKLG